MATRFHISAKDLRGAIGAYAKRFDLLEIAVRLDDRARSKTGVLPSLPTLKRWRKEAPPHFSFSVVAGPHVARLKSTPEQKKELEAVRAAVDVLQARCIVLRTPPEVTPAAVWKDRLAKFVADFPRDVTHVVWEPSGVWEIEGAAVCAKEWGIVLAVDASRDPVPAGNVAYVRLRAMGETRAFGPAALERVVEAIGPRRDAYVILETDTALQECKRLRQISNRAKASAEGGLGRLVRPRGGILVRDDEQE